jgi:hypothetical protein
MLHNQDTQVLLRCPTHLLSLRGGTLIDQYLCSDRPLTEATSWPRQTQNSIQSPDSDTLQAAPPDAADFHALRMDAAIWDVFESERCYNYITWWCSHKMHHTAVSISPPFPCWTDASMLG